MDIFLKELLTDPFVNLIWITQTELQKMKIEVCVVTEMLYQYYNKASVSDLLRCICKTSLQPHAGKKRKNGWFIRGAYLPRFDNNIW